MIRQAHQPETTPRFLNKRQVAEMFGVSERSVQEWAHHRGLPYIRLGQLIRFDPEAVERWALDQMRQTGS